MESSTFLHMHEREQSPAHYAESAQNISNWFPYPEYLHLLTGTPMFEQVQLPYGYNPYSQMHMNGNGMSKGHPLYVPHFHAAHFQEASFSQFNQAHMHNTNTYHLRSNEHPHSGPDQEECQDKGHEDNGPQAVWNGKRNTAVDAINVSPTPSPTMYSYGRFNGISADATDWSQRDDPDEVHTPRPRPVRQSKTKRLRTTFNGEQLKVLEEFFERDQYIGSVQRVHLAQALGLSESQIKIWWQNRRIKQRRARKSASQREFDVDYTAGTSVNSVNSTTSWMMPNNYAHL